MKTTQDMTYEAKCWGAKVRLTANWGDAADSVRVTGDPGDPWSWWGQVGDWGHRPALAMRSYLAELATASGDDPDDGEVAAEIEAAVAAMRCA